MVVNKIYEVLILPTFHIPVLNVHKFLSTFSTELFKKEYFYSSSYYLMPSFCDIAVSIVQRGGSFQNNISKEKLYLNCLFDK